MRAFRYLYPVWMVGIILTVACQPAEEPTAIKKAPATTQAPSAADTPKATPAPRASMPAGSGPTATPSAASGPTALKVGDPAPEFAFTKTALDGSTSVQAHLSDYRGKKNVVVAFFPKVFTGGCTMQMCGYRDEYSTFEGLGAEVIAVSADPQSESDLFKMAPRPTGDSDLSPDQKKLPFPVAGDPQHAIIEAYGAQRPGSPVATRSVFVVDQAGVIRYIDLNYNVQWGKDALYEALRGLGGAASAPAAPASPPSAPPA